MLIIIVISHYRKIKNIIYVLEIDNQTYIILNKIWCVKIIYLIVLAIIYESFMVKSIRYKLKKMHYNN